jgi:hypothetical protein
MEVVLLANIINAVGSVLCIWAHGQISMGENDKRGYWLYVIGCGVLIVGSIMLLSWPVVVLNVLWAGLSIMALREENYFKNIPDNLMQLSLYLSAIVGVACLVVGEYDGAAYMTTYIYFIAYAQLCAKLRSKLNYLTWCSIGFLLLIPHLLIAFQYSVLASESLGFVIGIIAIVKILIKKSELGTT